MDLYFEAHCLLQRLYRIITSEELVSPHHSAREMMDILKGRDFTKLFQKNVKKASNRFSSVKIVTQRTKAKWFCL
jgi:hypothetical protein